MDRRYITSPYISMDDLAKPWELSNSLITNPEYAKYLEKKENKNTKINSDEKSLTLRIKYNKR